MVKCALTGFTHLDNIMENSHVPVQVDDGSFTVTSMIFATKVTHRKYFGKEQTANLGPDFWTSGCEAEVLHQAITA